MKLTTISEVKNEWRCTSITTCLHSVHRNTQSQGFSGTDVYRKRKDGKLKGAGSR
jgi:hypothetical protein